MYSVIKNNAFTGTQYPSLNTSIANHHVGQSESFLLTEDPIEVPPKPGEEPEYRKPTPEELATAETCENISQMYMANIDTGSIAIACYLSIAKGDNTLIDI